MNIKRNIWLSCLFITLSYAFSACSKTLTEPIGTQEEPEDVENKEKLSIGLSPIIQDDMVVQQGKPFTFWGRANTATTFVIHPEWSDEGVTVSTSEDGRWEARVSVPTVQSGDFTPRQILFKDTEGVEITKLSNVLIGEVWFCSGQSNMNMSMRPDLPWHEGVLAYANEIAAANHPGLRLFKIRAAFYDTPNEMYEGNWNVCTPESVATYSGVAYYLGKELMERLQLPVGIVLASLGGTSCQAFTSKEVLLGNAELKEKYWDVDNLEMDNNLRPSRLYNGIIYPLTRFSIKGFAWYQGESNAGLEDKSLYTRLNSAMVQGWRNDFGEATLPFYFVQMTPYNWGGDNFFNWNYARFREAQEDVTNSIDHAGMAVTMDIGEPTKIHPRNKKDVGIRLAKLALYHDYGFSEEFYKGPEYASMEASYGQVILTFDPTSIGSGLETNDGGAPKHFWIAGPNKTFVLATAEIDGNQVILRNARIRQPVAVRYAFMNYPLTNFQNKEGLPAAPFRTDDWMDSTYDRSVIPD